MTIERLLMQRQILRDFDASGQTSADRAIIAAQLAEVSEQINALRDAAEIDAMTPEERRAQVAPVRPGGVD